MEKENWRKRKYYYNIYHICESLIMENSYGIINKFVYSIIHMFSLLLEVQLEAFISQMDRYKEN